MRRGLDVVFLGLSLTSSWGNGHATTYRALLRELRRRGHHLVFLERDVPWYAEHRDLAAPSYAEVVLYASLDELRSRHATLVRDASVVVVGSFVPDGIAVGEWVVGTARGLTCFYDIDTPVTLEALARRSCEYLSPDLVRRYHLYLSFTGGPTLQRLERQLGAQAARALYCSVDPEHYYPENREARWELGYLGTYSTDRQPALDRLFLDTARRAPGGRFVVAGPQYPTSIVWPPNVDRLEHVPPPQHRAFYTSQLTTLNLTREDMKRAGYSPSVRLFEAAACGTPVVSDSWPGLEELFEPGSEVLLAASTEETLGHLAQDPERLRQVGFRARRRVLTDHTAGRRAAQLEGYFVELLGSGRTPEGRDQDRAATG